MNIIKESGLKLGLAAGAFYSVFLIILFTLGAEAYQSNWKLIPFVVMLILAFFAGASEKSKSGGFITFGHSVVVVFSVFIIAEFVSSLTEWLIFNVFDPEFHLKIKPILIEKTAEWVNSIEKIIPYGKGDKEEIFKSVNEADYKFYVMSAINKFITWLVIDFIFVLGISAIIQRNPKAQ